MLQFDVTHALPFLPKNWMSSRLDGLTEACNLLERGNGLGGQFTGWVKLPETYDRQEVQRLLGKKTMENELLKEAVDKCKKDGLNTEDIIKKSLTYI